MDASFTLEQPKLPPPEHPLKKVFHYYSNSNSVDLLLQNVIVFFPELVPISLQLKQEPIQKQYQPPQQQPSTQPNQTPLLPSHQDKKCTPTRNKNLCNQRTIK